MRKDIHAYYHALGLSPGAGPLEIRRAYRQLMRQWHPDLFNPGSPMQATAEDITKEANEAFEQLYRKKLYRKFPPKAETSGDPAQDPADEPQERHPDSAQGKPRADGRAPRGKRRAAAPSGTTAPRHPPWIERVTGVFRRASWAKAAVAAGLVLAGVLGVHWMRNPSPVPPQTTSAAAAASGEADAPASTAPLAEEAAPEAASPENPTAVAPAAGAPAGVPFDPSRRARAAAAGSSQPRSGIRELEADGLARLRMEGGGPRQTVGSTLRPARDGRPARGLGATAAPAIAALRAYDRPWPASPEPRLSALAARDGIPEEGGGARPAVGLGGRGLDSSVREIEALLDRAEGLLDVFDIGDSKARVVAVQGMPDAAGYGLYRYGSSLVYFSDGYVSGWSDDLPRLHVRLWPSLDAVSVDTFSVGSSYGDVFRAQGAPSAFSATSYTYGTSVVHFMDERVTGWSEGDVTLRGFRLPALPFGAWGQIASR